MLIFSDRIKIPNMALDSDADSSMLKAPSYDEKPTKKIMEDVILNELEHLHIPTYVYSVSAI